MAGIKNMLNNNKLEGSWNLSWTLSVTNIYDSVSKGNKIARFATFAALQQLYQLRPVSGGPAFNMKEFIVDNPIAVAF